MHGWCKLYGKLLLYWMYNSINSMGVSSCSSKLGYATVMSRTSIFSLVASDSCLQNHGGWLYCSKCLWVHTLGHPRVDPVGIKDILLSCNCSTLTEVVCSYQEGMRMLAVFVHGQTVCPPYRSPLAPTKDQICLLWPCCPYVTETPST